MDNEEYFGRTAEDAAEFDALGALSGTGDPQPLEPSPADISPDPATAYLTLADIERETGISYVTLIRYSQQYRDRLPSEGEGNRRRYYPAAITEFERIWYEKQANRMGGQKATSAATETKSAPPEKRHRRGRKKTGRSKPKISPPVVSSPLPPAKLVTGASQSSASDLDRMARVYQLKIQRKALDGVLSFVTEWWTRINAEIEGLEK